MEKKQGNSGNRSTSSSSQKTFGTNKLQIGEDVSSRLLGSIIEKGISDKPQNKPTPAPKLTVLPFPVARHRSHGPRWDPVGSNMANNGDNADNEDDEDDNQFDVQPVAAFATPVKRKQKKGLDFSRWKEIVPSHDSSAGKETKENASSVGKTVQQRKGVKEIKTADMRAISCGSSLEEEDISLPEKMDVEDDSNVCLPVNKTEEAMTSDSGVDSVAAMELDENSKIQYPKNVEDGNYSMRPVSDQRGVDRMLSDDLAEAHCEKMDPALLGVLKKRDKKSSSATTVFSSRSNNIGNDQGSMSLKSEIDAENRARLQSMSPDEIAEAQAEIMEKMDPALLNLLKKRGQDKLKMQKCSSSVRDTNIVETDNALNESHTTQDAIVSPQLQEGIHPSQSGQDDGVLKTSDGAGSFLWNVWSERVEAVRELRFSLDGSVISRDIIPKSETGDHSAQNKLGANNVSERDYLRTEGDPGAAGYTIKEAVSLTRSAVPGQRALALNLLASVLDKALHNIHQNQVGLALRYNNKVDKSTDWEAVWAYALGPEPELVLALRMSLDDNHNSVVLACLKVVHCAVSCDLNEYFFDISEKVAVSGKDIFTAPVFRSKPEIDLGFLHGGYWKYNAKVSNILPPSEDIMDDETEEKHTIQDDIFVAGQDFAAGLVRMEILPRLRYILETDPTAAMEESIISILIALARHSPTCANAIMKCERLVQTVVHRFTTNNSAEVIPFKIKSVCLLKVLAWSDKKNCLEFIKSGIFQAMTWHLYGSVSSLEQWVKLGRENCKISSGLMVEQLRFWKVCIQYGYCVSYFPDIFPAFCLWLNPPSVEKVIENNVLSAFASISAEVYLVLEALAGRLPNFYSQEHPEFGDDMETWSWSHVGPMLDSALKWLALKNNLLASNFLERHKGIGSQCAFQDLSLSPLLWVYSAIMLFLARVLKRVVPEDDINLHGSGRHLPWLPEFVPKVGLELLKNGFLSSLDANDSEYGTNIAPGCSFIEELCHIRRQVECETSLASVSCLCGLVQVIFYIDSLIRLSKAGIPTTNQGNNISREETVLEEGILKQSLVELRWVLKIFMELVASEWHSVQSVEKFGRGGPAPGVAIGWGASGGGFWSTTVLLGQTDAQLLIHLLEIFQTVSVSELQTDEKMNFAVHIVDSALGICLSAGPRDKIIVDNAIDILVQVPVLKSLDLFIRRYLQSREKMKLFGWEYKEEDYLHFSKILTSHFKNRWLGVKRKSKAIVGNSSSESKTFKKGSASLDTIPEELDPSIISSQDYCCSSLAVEWAHQRLPLPMHWFLSPISTICDGNQVGLLSVSKTLNCAQNPNVLEVAKCGLFFVLGIEAIASLVSSKIPSPVQSAPLLWKLHSLSVTLLAGMGVLEEEKSKDVFEALQEHYGLLLDEALSSRSARLVLKKNANSLPETGKNRNVELLRFKSEVHESYSTFIETFVEQFAAISYGDLLYGRQVAVYLHRCVEASVRLAAWNALFNVRALELLPPLEKCLAEVEGYLEPVEDDKEILEAYVKSWTAGALDRAALRGSMSFTVALHHLSSSIFLFCPDDKLPLRNKLVKSLLRDYSREQRHERLMLNLVHYSKPSKSQMLEQNGGSSLQPRDVEKRFEILTEACEGNFSLLIAINSLKNAIMR